MDSPSLQLYPSALWPLHDRAVVDELAGELNLWALYQEAVRIIITQGKTPHEALCVAGMFFEHTIGRKIEDLIEYREFFAAFFPPIDSGGTCRLSRQGVNGGGEFCYSSKKQIFPDFKVCGGLDAILNQRDNCHWITVADDDDLHLTKDFACPTIALEFYLKWPIITSWEWLMSMGFEN